MLFRNILQAGYRGVVYPVNPSWKSVSGVRCYPTVADLPETPELAVVIVPAPLVTGVMTQLGERGTRGAVVISAGFREIGGAGIGREEELIASAKKYGMSLVGPNCFGVINTAPEVSLNATFSEDLPPKGNIAFVSQSGALCAGILRYGISERIGFSRFVSVGNRAGVEESDILRSLGADPHTQVILLYIESLANERRFLDAAREVSKLKPILVIKSGRSPEGERAARSHTGSLAHAAQDRLYDALFEQAGVLRADTIGELFREAKVFSTGARLEGSRLAILTNSGGRASSRRMPPPARDCRFRPCRAEPRTASGSCSPPPRRSVTPSTRPPTSRLERLAPHSKNCWTSPKSMDAWSSALPSRNCRAPRSPN